MFPTIAKRTVTLWVGLILLATFSLGSYGLEAANLHAIIIADTKDPSIGVSTATDFENMRRELQNVALYTGLNLKETTVRDREMVPEKVLDKINKLKIEKDDVVVFYFSGHGFRTPSKGESPWPNLYFSLVEKGIDYDLIGQKLESQKPRLLLIIADACNNVIPNEYAPPLVRKMLMKPIPEKTIEKNYRKLFLGVEGVIMVTSSKAGEVSWGTERGGLFTVAFLQNIATAVKSSSEPSWFSILDNAALQVQSDQHPEFRIFIDDLRLSQG